MPEETPTQDLSAPSIVDYDFKNPRRIQPEQKETLKLIHETYAQNLSLALSSFLRTDTQVTLQSTEQQTFAEYMRSLNNPTCVAIFEMQLLNGYGLLEINSALVYSVVDRMMGGAGKINNVVKTFTSVELTIAKRLIQLLLKELGSAWEYLIKLSFELKDVQTNPAFVRITPDREICVIVTLKVQIGETPGLITLCLPYSNLELLSPKLSSQQSTYTITPSPETKEHLKNVIGGVEVELTAVLGSLQLTMEDLLSLQVGDILNIGQKARQPISLAVAGKEKFKVSPGLIGKFKGVSIEKEIIKE